MSAFAFARSFSSRTSSASSRKMGLLMISYIGLGFTLPFALPLRSTLNHDSTPTPSPDLDSTTTCHSASAQNSDHSLPPSSDSPPRRSASPPRLSSDTRGLAPGVLFCPSAV
ncbi:hypothetical protein BZA70DRAFT_267566 [Myxozyma melibiosi]|uniref:Uncharacterized protein n=1 Tax=Myxozyma melibiosi TaxID=54550 RepID=A0ABR1F5C2_9ASCO